MSPQSLIQAANGARERYLKEAAEVRDRDAKFCPMCGSIGWLVMQRAVFTEMLSRMDFSDPDWSECREALAELLNTDVPVHPADQ